MGKVALEQSVRIISHNMKFHFEFEIKKLPNPISHNHQLLLIGSCFTENIAARLRSYKFHSIENPNGIIFNPVSVTGINNFA